jgi:VanZ family protein
MKDSRPQRFESIAHLLVTPAFAYAATILLALAIAIVTLMPPGYLPVQPPGSDKLHHLLGFAALAFPIALARPRRLVFMLPAFFAFGAVIELLQPRFGRSAEFADLIADGIGILIGTALGLVARKVLVRQASPRPVS